MSEVYAFCTPSDRTELRGLESGGCQRENKYLTPQAAHDKRDGIGNGSFGQLHGRDAPSYGLPWAIKLAVPDSGQRSLARGPRPTLALLLGPTDRGAFETQWVLRSFTGHGKGKSRSRLLILCRGNGCCFRDAPKGHELGDHRQPRLSDWPRRRAQGS